ELLSEAAVMAVETGKEQIDIELLSEIDWMSPTQRKTQSV
nr:AAA family ATPase [Vibrio anguillarum]